MGKTQVFPLITVHQHSRVSLSRKQQHQTKSPIPVPCLLSLCPVSVCNRFGEGLWRLRRLRQRERTNNPITKTRIYSQIVQRQAECHTLLDVVHLDSEALHSHQVYMGHRAESRGRRAVRGPAGLAWYQIFYSDGGWCIVLILVFLKPDTFLAPPPLMLRKRYPEFHFCAYGEPIFPFSQDENIIFQPPTPILRNPFFAGYRFFKRLWVGVPGDKDWLEPVIHFGFLLCSIHDLCFVISEKFQTSFRNGSLA